MTPTPTGTTPTRRDAARAERAHGARSWRRSPRCSSSASSSRSYIGGADDRHRRARLRRAAVPGRRDRPQPARAADERRATTAASSARTARCCASSSSSSSRCSASATRWCRSTRRSARRPGCATSRRPTRSTNTQVDATRTVRIEFDSNVRNLPWQFRPLRADRQRASGRADAGRCTRSSTPPTAPMTGQAIPSYGPQHAAQYFQKLECFCFTKQTLQPGETRQMPVVFVIDPAAAGATSRRSRCRTRSSRSKGNES